MTPSAQPGRTPCEPRRALPADLVVIGSANADLVVPVERRPGAGETVLGGDLAVRPGGKGANQAVAAARLGARVAFTGCLGRDAHGDLLLSSLRAAGVDVSGVRVLDDAPTGVALISVTPDGDNAIIVSPGANARADLADVRRAIERAGTGAPDTAGQPDAAGQPAAAAGQPAAAARTATTGRPPVVVLQLELPGDVVAGAVRLAADAGSRVVLNLAPPAALPPDVLSLCDPLVLNEHEAAVLLGSRGPGATGTARAVLARGPRSVVLTLGSAGAVVAERDGVVRVPAPVLVPVDTTGAGDALTGALAFRLAAGDALIGAVRFAVRVASTSTLRPGAQPSFPQASEVLPG